MEGPRQRALPYPVPEGRSLSPNSPHVDSSRGRGGQFCHWKETCCSQPEPSGRRPLLRPSSPRLPTAACA